MNKRKKKKRANLLKKDSERACARNSLYSSGIEDHPEVDYYNADERLMDMVEECSRIALDDTFQNNTN